MTAPISPERVHLLQEGGIPNDLEERAEQYDEHRVSPARVVGQAVETRLLSEVLVLRGAFAYRGLQTGELRPVLADPLI